MQKFYSIQKFEQAADIYIYGDIVPLEIFEGEVSAAGFVAELEALDVPVINVHIDSYGGAVSEGWAMYNALRKHPAKVNTYGDGFVASAALFPFLAGDERYAASVSGYYLHKVMSGGFGYAEDLRKAADEADVLTEIGINAFVERTNLDADTVRELMDGETWLTPAQALEYGIATAIVASPATRQTQSAKKQILETMFAQKAPEQPPEQMHDPAPEQKREPEQLDNQPLTIMQMVGGYFNA